MSEDNPLVYSTDQGRVNAPEVQPKRAASDGIVRIQRETKGRKGKGVTLVTGLPLLPDEMKALAKKLKKHCGVGGSVKNECIEIQGDQRESCKTWLQKQGYKVKLAGG